MKHPYSKLASFFSCLEKIPKRNGHIFLDRNYSTFMNLLDFLKTDKIPKINNRTEKCNFFDELDYWGIKLKIEKKRAFSIRSKFLP